MTNSPKKLRRKPLFLITALIMLGIFSLILEFHANMRHRLAAKMPLSNKTAKLTAAQGISYGPIMVDLEGTTLSKADQQILMHKNVGGVLLSNNNYESKERLRNLVQSIRKLRKNIIVAVDQEGGNIQLRGNGFKALPSARVYGDLYNIDPKISLELAYKYGKQTAKDLTECDIDLNLGPVIDLYGKNNKVGGLDRAFHSQPNVVFELSNAYINGMNVIGMSAVAKHFPGHGTCEENPKDDLPVCYESYLQLTDKDLVPFKELIYLNKLDAIMVSPFIYPVVDQENPVGSSRIWLQGTLRQELGFEGVIISEYTFNKKTKTKEDANASILTALKAGSDLIIVNKKNRKDLLNILNSLEWQASDESVARLSELRLKNH